MYSRIGAAAFKADITNTVELCKILDNPQTKFKSVHIGGTNGKGSTSHMLASIFQTAGYKTGLYTSPHLKDFRERIRVNGDMISEANVMTFIENMKPVIEAMKPSFFEITVAMAFDYFVKQEVDIAIIEVGLGGRLDSTNVIVPELSIITNISLDHMNLLGDTHEKIAFEKAGIIKVKIPVVVGSRDEKTAHVFETVASQQHAPLYFADKNRFVSDFQFKTHSLVAEVTASTSSDKTLYELDLPGIYQAKNLLTVLEAVHHLREIGWNLPETVLPEALAHVKKITGLHGRWETIQENPTVILDVGHNEDGMSAIANHLERCTFQHLRIVIGMVKDKEIEKALSFLPKSATYYFTRAQIPRALPEDELASKGNALGMEGQHYPDVNTALRSAVSDADKKDLILVCGSVFVVGEVDRMHVVV
jgi:dihydrofolate synthase/folylpolyglutamate synthase